MHSRARRSAGRTGPSAGGPQRPPPCPHGDHCGRTGRGDRPARERQARRRRQDPQERHRLRRRGPYRLHGDPLDEGLALPKVTTEYDPVTGDAVMTTAGGKSLSRTMDGLGRLTSYTDADGGTSPPPQRRPPWPRTPWLCATRVNFLLRPAPADIAVPSLGVTTPSVLMGSPEEACLIVRFCTTVALTTAGATLLVALAAAPPAASRTLPRGQEDLSVMSDEEYAAAYGKDRAQAAGLATATKLRTACTNSPTKARRSAPSLRTVSGCHGTGARTR